MSFTFCFLLPVNIASYHSPSRAGIFFFFFHKTPFIFYPRTLSTPTSHHKSINIRKLSDISCSVQWTSNTFFNTFLNLESSQIKIWKLCVNVIFSLAFLKCFKLAAWIWRFACFFSLAFLKCFKLAAWIWRFACFFAERWKGHETKLPDCYCAG